LINFPFAEKVMSSATVIVTNIAPTAVEKDVTDLFSFCGKIKAVKMRRFDKLAILS